ncbi:hypothetical protein KCU97_g2951, partial [Aureobasidium melanogenum]
MTSHHQRDWAGKPVSTPNHSSPSAQPAPSATTQGNKTKPQPKKLRFITSQGAPQAKRRRVSTACLVCRKRKVACSGERPHCNTCTNNRLECTGYADENGSGNPNVDETETPRAAAPILRRSETADSMKAPPARKSKSAEFKSQNQSTTTTYIGNPTPNALEHVQPQSSRNDNDQSYFPKPTPSLFSGARNRMPYFRWLGPTAIMPGFKQMVVKV